MITDYIHIIIYIYEMVRYNWNVHKPSIFTSEVIMEAESPPNH